MIVLEIVGSVLAAWALIDYLRDRARRRGGE